MANNHQQNNDRNTHNNTEKNNKNTGTPHQGSVQHSDDGRLKENRDKGVHRGDKE
ncbi:MULTISPECIES: hypothetical protein [Methylobacterium]|uniref:hypothetical protein n=1 Tax=Methylobacterium TaxID=407 RepID=UPI001404E2EF|nr:MULTISPECIES: hypothetical protein [Methylobacterium]MDR7039039.1 hypothetical protein [Methylobacterium sp. BE186]